MTKTLLVNCYIKAAEIAGLQKVLEKHNQVTTVPYGEIGSGYQMGEFDAVVVSGSEARIVKPQDKAMYSGVLELIRTCKVPLLGICFGHQLLCSAFGAKTGTLSQPVINRFEQVRLIQACDLFSDFPEGQTVTLAQYHNDYAMREGLEEAGLKLLADSPSCEVEAVKHETRPFYGVQFHPERETIKKESHLEGHSIIRNFYRGIVKQ
jgi:GMP synthase-like glutamine amidotransferase